MFHYDHKLRVRYGETDTMGIVHHGNYPLYYEEARTEMLRSIGLSYAELERQGTMMPVVDMHIKYIAPAYFDDVLTVRVSLKEAPTARIVFHYDVINPEGKTINQATVTLAFMDAVTRRPRRAPQPMVDEIVARL
jgi:acyl-CoA thioester hydrolase